MHTRRAGQSPHPFQAAAQAPESPVAEKGFRPQRRTVLLKISEDLLHLPGPGRLKLTVQQGVEPSPSSPSHPGAATQQVQRVCLSFCATISCRPLAVARLPPGVSGPSPDSSAS